MTQNFDQATIIDLKDKISLVNQKLSANQSLTIQDRQTVSNYYTYLNEVGISYGKVGYEMVNNQGTWGYIGNVYFDKYLENYYDMSASQMQTAKDKFMVGVALSDADLRVKTTNGVIFKEYEEVAKYHYKVLDALHIDREAWGGSFLETFGGAGSAFNLGSINTSTDISQVGMLWSLVTNETIDKVNARKSFSHLLETMKEAAPESFDAVSDRGVLALRSWILGVDGNTVQEIDQFSKVLSQVKSGETIYFDSGSNGLLGNEDKSGKLYKKESDGSLTKVENNSSKANFEIKQGDQTHVFNSSLLLKEEAKFFNKNGEEISPSDAIIKLEDTELGKLTVIRTDVSTTLADNTTATLGTILDTIESSSKAFDSFVGSGVSSITKKLFGVESNMQGLAAEIALSLASGQNLEETATKIAIREILISPAFDRIAQELNGVFTDSKELDALREALLSTQDGTEQLNILTQSLGSENEALKAIDFQKLQSSPMFDAVKGAIVQFVVISVIDQIDGGDKMDSEEYAEAAAQIITQQAVSLGVSHYFGTKATALTPASITPGGFGVGVGVGHLASAAVSDLFADDHMNSHQWQSTTMTAAAMGATAFAIGSAAVAMGLIQAGALLGPVGFAIGIVAAVIVTQVFGGKEYGPGEYPDPYSYLKIEAKEDGTGNRIIGIESEGVVAIAREYYHDDLYGNSGSDNLIGKSGTNTIYGYAGNDHLEGRGDIDLLVAGDGDDEAFGGNGDDQIYGGNGSDNLFGGNGNDVIIGGTGASVGGSGSLEDGADFIQGGNGDDQIMGEAGNDTIQGNSGNDTILGGTGNDRIEGNEGDDSILGEDGDDMILGGAGSDIIDGGAGKDYIEGNEGNDNIRGGDGNDEIFGNSGVDIIYGDAGNDLINSGSENDLVFGGLGNDIIYGADGDDTLSGELGNDYVIGAEGADTIDGGAGDDVLFGGIGDDIITTGEGNDTIIYRTGDGQDTINDTDTEGSNTLKLSEINSKLSDNTTNKIILTKSGTDLIIEFKDDSGSIITGDKITVTNQFGGAEENGSGSEILKKIEFADGKAIANDNFLTERKIQKLKRN